MWGKQGEKAPEENLFLHPYFAKKLSSAIPGVELLLTSKNAVVLLSLAGEEEMIIVCLLPKSEHGQTIALGVHHETS